jgi:hypothetical protein
MSSIQADVNDLNNVRKELKRLRETMRNLQNLQKEYEKRILDYLETNDQPGVRYKGVTIIADEKQKRKYQRKADKLERGERMLRELGISDGKKVLENLLENLKGTPETRPVLKFLE